MRLASEKMEMHELLEQAALLGDDYARGFQEGFRASRVLYQKYRCVESGEKEIP